MTIKMAICLCPPYQMWRTLTFTSLVWMMNCFFHENNKGISKLRKVCFEVNLRNAASLKQLHFTYKQCDPHQVKLGGYCPQPQVTQLLGRNLIPIQCKLYYPFSSTVNGLQLLGKENFCTWKTFFMIIVLRSLRAYPRTIWKKMHAQSIRNRAGVPPQL